MSAALCSSCQSNTPRRGQRDCRDCHNVYNKAHKPPTWEIVRALDERLTYVEEVLRLVGDRKPPRQAPPRRALARKAGVA